jgi:hypothetical protein
MHLPRPRPLLPRSKLHRPPPPSFPAVAHMSHSADSSGVGMATGLPPSGFAITFWSWGPQKRPAPRLRHSTRGKSPPPLSPSGDETPDGYPNPKKSPNSIATNLFMFNHAMQRNNSRIHNFANHYTRTKRITIAHPYTSLQLLAFSVLSEQTKTNRKSCNLHASCRPHLFC